MYLLKHLGFYVVMCDIFVTEKVGLGEETLKSAKEEMEMN